MTETVKCKCGEPVTVNREKDLVVCPSCGAIVYKRLTDYLRESFRTQLKKRKREHER